VEALASLLDLEDRNIAVTDAGLAATMLAVASASIRGAAGSPISQVTSTITYDGYRPDRYLRLFGPPVTAVVTVEVDGTAVPATEWRLTGDGRLWRRCGWGVDDGPCLVDVTQTHGLPAVPEDIVDLACSYAATGLAASADGYATHGGVVAERIDDYSVSYAQGAEAVATAMQIPPATRTWLSSMFGGSAAMVSTRS
jgi:hypothetical protein